MKHRLLLDEMLLYHAIKCVDEDENPDLAAADLIRLIGENCHTIMADKVLLQRYHGHIGKLFGTPSLLVPTAAFVVQLLENSTKFIRESNDPPELPPSVRIPREDIHVVRAALISNPIVVTSERRLLNAINSQREILGLRALRPAEALELARET